MKNFFLFFSVILTAASLTCCEYISLEDESQKSFINVCFDSGYLPSTKAITEIPDTNDFILTITSADGNTIYTGKFGDCRKNLPVDAGTYIVSVKSGSISEPLFDNPQYGDEQTIVVPAGQTFRAIMKCTMINCGIKLVTAPSFRTRFPNGVLYIKSSTGKLMYGYAESRIAYFSPGAVVVELAENSQTKTLFSRNLEAAKILKISLNSVEPTQEAESINIQIDTTLSRINESFTYGGENSGEDPSYALSVSQFTTRAPGEEIWVYGYIVGVSSSSTKSVFSPPFQLNTNILLAERSNVSDRNECISVELPKGDLRNAVNLVDNPGNLGKQIFLKGKVAESYYGLPGLKSATKWQWK